MLRVVEVIPLSESSPDSEVLLTDGYFECLAFSSPTTVRIGDEVREPLHLFGLRSVMLSEGLELGIAQPSEGHPRRLVATVVTLDPLTVGVGRFRFEIDDYAFGGIQVGDIVQIECGRMDLW